MYFALHVYERKATWQSNLQYYHFDMKTRPMAINPFGSTDEDSTNSQELKIVPAWLDEVINDNKGVRHLCLFLDCPDMQINDGQNDDEDTTFDAEANKDEILATFDSMPCYYAAHSNTDQKQEFFDKKRLSRTEKHPVSVSRSKCGARVCDDRSKH